MLKRILLIVAGAFVVLIPVAITFTIGWRPILGPRSRPLTDRKFEPTPARIQRGDYLVHSVAGCFGCHSEPDTNSPELPPKPGREGAGQFAATDPTLGDVIMPNITPDKETGIGNWTDDEIGRAVREGIDRDGNMLFPIMPYSNFRTMSDEDLASVVVYLRTIPPIKNSPGKMKPPFPLNRLVMGVPEPITAPVPSPDLSDAMIRGTYLVKLASCADCHTPSDSMGQPIGGLEFAGGSPMHRLDGANRASLNITPDTSGLSYFDESIFFTIIRNGKYGARTLKAPMPWYLYKNMTDVDAEVRNLKAKGVAFEHYEMPGLRLEGDIHVAGPMRVAWFKDPDGNILNITNR